MRKISFIPTAYDDYLGWLQKDKKIFLKITNLIQEAARNPTEGTGNPELLKHEFAGLWSRRINLEHRLIYSFTDSEIIINSCKYHYKQK